MEEPDILHSVIKIPTTSIHNNIEDCTHITDDKIDVKKTLMSYAKMLETSANKIRTLLNYIPDTNNLIIDTNDLFELDEHYIALIGDKYIIEKLSEMKFVVIQHEIKEEK